MTDDHESYVIPEMFTDEDICMILNNLSAPQGEEQSTSLSSFSYWNHFPLVCGVLIRMRSGLQRVYRRSECRFPRRPDHQAEQFYQLVEAVVYEKEELRHHWSHQTLWQVAEELTLKSLNLSLPLNRRLQCHPLYPLHPSSEKMVFQEDFVQQVRLYQASLQRPEGTFTVTISPQLEALCEMERTLCPRCNGRRQLYCGPCGGLRMPAAEELLPPRLSLPFDILLLLHWNESLVKCTGIHAAALAQERSVTYTLWNKPTEEWTNLVRSLDATRDVILFPYEDSTVADEFDWEQRDDGERPRLVVLEASWAYGKTMAHQIVSCRKEAGLPSLRSVILKNVVGQYWRFQSEGQSAVSTIEAIAHTAKAAGMSEEHCEDLLTLFRVQKYRVLRNTEERGKLPRAMDTTGAGLGSWKEVEVINKSTP
eukprot:gene8247-9095_t